MIFFVMVILVGLNVFVGVCMVICVFDCFFGMLVVVGVIVQLFGVVMVMLVVLVVWCVVMIILVVVLVVIVVGLVMLSVVGLLIILWYSVSLCVGIFIVIVDFVWDFFLVNILVRLIVFVLKFVLFRGIVIDVGVLLVFRMFIVCELFMSGFVSIWILVEFCICIVVDLSGFWLMVSMCGFVSRVVILVDVLCMLFLVMRGVVISVQSFRCVFVLLGDRLVFDVFLILSMLGLFQCFGFVVVVCLIVFLQLNIMLFQELEMLVDVCQSWLMELVYCGKFRVEQYVDRLYMIGWFVVFSVFDIWVNSFCVSCFFVIFGFFVYIFGDFVVFV